MNVPNTTTATSKEIIQLLKAERLRLQKTLHDMDNLITLAELKYNNAGELKISYTPCSTGLSVTINGDQYNPHTIEIARSWSLRGNYGSDLCDGLIPELEQVQK